MIKPALDLYPGFSSHSINDTISLKSYGQQRIDKIAGLTLCLH
jgi:hypothetical protein